VNAARKTERGAIAKTLEHWQEDTDLAGVRDASELAGLSADERAAWKSLWAKVDALASEARKP
jgi:hypothetical protein